MVTIYECTMVPVQIFQVTPPKVIVASNVELNYIKSKFYRNWLTTASRNNSCDGFAIT